MSGELTARRRRVEHGQHNHMVPIGVIISLALNVVALVFSAGILWQRVINVETNMLALQLKTEKENGDISAILQKLSAIEVRLEPRLSLPSSKRP
jgi:hypothetical protein